MKQLVQGQTRPPLGWPPSLPPPMHVVCQVLSLPGLRCSCCSVVSLWAAAPGTLTHNATHGVNLEASNFQRPSQPHSVWGMISQGPSPLVLRPLLWPAQSQSCWHSWPSPGLALPAPPHLRWQLPFSDLLKGPQESSVVRPAGFSRIPWLSLPFGKGTSAGCLQECPLLHSGLHVASRAPDGAAPCPSDCSYVTNHPTLSDIKQ